MTDHFTDHATDHAQNMNAISLMRKMIRDALLFPSPLLAYFSLIRNCNGALARKTTPSFGKGMSVV
jgi:hypothetical protein